MASTCLLLLGWWCATVAPQDAEPFLLGPPPSDGPVVVQARFDLRVVDAIDDEQQTLSFVGDLVLRWTDPRMAFDPAVAGVDERVYQGAYQFNEVSPGWFPQVVLSRPSLGLEETGVVLRVAPDGSSVLVQTIGGTVRAPLSVRRYPFDAHRLEIGFELLGFGADEVALAVDDTPPVGGGQLGLPQWRITGVELSGRPVGPEAGADAPSGMVLALSVERESFFVVRLVVIPLMVIVFLSFSVFWMDRSSLGDRINVSFIGILTGVAYQFVMSDHLPRIAYFTLMHGFLNLSYLTMCATVVINLRVGALDARGRVDAGDRVDRRCRRIFPLVYFGLIGVMLVIAFTVF